MLGCYLSTKFFPLDGSVVVLITHCCLAIKVAEGYPPNMKRTLLLHFLNLFQSRQLGHDHLVVVMQMLILPMLAHAFQNGQTWDVVDSAIIKTIVDKLLDPPEEVNDCICLLLSSFIRLIFCLFWVYFIFFPDISF